MSSFEERLKTYNEAMAEEFAKDSTDAEEIKRLTTKLFVEEMPMMAKQLRYIAQHADKESDQLAAIKFAFEFIFGKPGGKAQGGTTLDDLINKLTENDATVD